MPLRVRLPFSSEGEFIQRYGPNVGRGGVFVATRAPKPEGTALSFEFVLSDGTSLLRGEGLVVRSRAQGTSRPGMTVQYRKLDPSSRELVDRIVARRQSQGARTPSPTTPSPLTPAPTPLPLTPSPAEGLVTPPSALPPLPPTAAAGPTLPPPLTARPRPGAFRPPDEKPEKQHRKRLPDPDVTVPERRLSERPQPPSPRLRAQRADADLTEPFPTPAFTSLEEDEAPQTVERDVPTELSLLLPTRRKSRLERALGGGPLLPLSPLSPEEVDLDELGPVLGLDVGTRFARAAVLEHGLPVLIPFDDEARIYDLPTALTLVRGIPRRVPLGEGGASEEQVSGVVALLGRRRDDPLLAGLDRIGPAELTADARGDVLLTWGEGSFRPQELVALLLQSIKTAAEEHTQRQLRLVSFAVSAGMHDVHRRALKEAAALAGLQTVGFVQAASAAALAFGSGRGLARKRVLVFHLGASAFDACVAELTGEDAESIWSMGEVSLEPLLQTPTLEADRARVDRALTRTLSGLESAQLPLSKLDGVLLSGGFSLDTELRTRMEEALGVASPNFADPASALARGAALVGQARVAQSHARVSLSLSEVLGNPLDLVLTPGGATRLFDRSTRLPAEKTVTTTCSQPQVVEAALFEGEGPARTYLGLARLEVTLPGEVSLRVEANTDGLLSVVATVPRGEPRPLTLTRAEPPSSAPATETQDVAPPPRPSKLMRSLARLFKRD